MAIRIMGTKSTLLRTLVAAKRGKSAFPVLYRSGGEGGIRTHGGLAPTAVFKTAALNHSATSPRRLIADCCGGDRKPARPRPASFARLFMAASRASSTRHTAQTEQSGGCYRPSDNPPLHATASRPSKLEQYSRTFAGLLLAKRFSQGPGFNECLLNALVGHALFKEQHALAHRALSGLSVFDPSRLVPKTAPAFRASDQK